MSSGLRDTAEVLDRVRDLTPLVSERARETEANRSVSDDVVARLREVGAFSLALPASLGGLEADAQTIIRVVEEVSRADGSTGWTVLIGQGAAFLAWLDHDAAADIVARTPRPIIAGSMTPNGRVTRVASVTEGGRDGWQLSGRWPFNSASRHADWFIGAFTDDSGGQAAADPTSVRFAFFPAAEVTLDDNWRVMGLRGTGSHDMEVHDITVPGERVMAPFACPARVGAPLYRLPFLSFLVVMMAGFPIGVAQRALDEMVSVVHRKVKPGSRRPLADDPLAQAQVVRARTALDAARAVTFDTVAELWQQLVADGEARTEVRVALVAAVQHSMRVASEIVDVAFQLGGASALYDDNPLQRCFRDIHAARQHILFGSALERRLGALMLGRPMPGPSI